eukprot:gene23334-biopygen20811
MPRQRVIQRRLRLRMASALPSIPLHSRTAWCGVSSGRSSCWEFPQRTHRCRSSGMWQPGKRQRTRTGRGPGAGRTIEFEVRTRNGRGPDAGVAVSPWIAHTFPLGSNGKVSQSARRPLHSVFAYRSCQGHIPDVEVSPPGSCRCCGWAGLGRVPFC